MDTLKEIWTSLSERFKNPLLYSFFFSWLLINYKIPIVLFGDAKHTEKISFIDSYIHPTTGDHLVQLVYAPSICALAYVFLLPIVSLLSTYATAVYERWHQDIRTEQARKAILTKEQREKLEKEVSDLNNRLRIQAQEAETKLNNADANMRLCITRLNQITSPIWFKHLKSIAPSWGSEVLTPPPGREIKGTKDQQEFAQTLGIPGNWAKVFEVLRKPEGVRPHEIEGPLNVGESEALEILVSLCALNMLTPNWHNGALHFKLVESSWVALLNGRPA